MLVLAVSAVATGLLVVAAAMPSSVRTSMTDGDRDGAWVARGDVVTRATRVDALYALNGLVLYRRESSDSQETWYRLMDAKRLPVEGLPSRVRPSTIGRDRAGRVVVTFSRILRDRPGRRWWSYDVAADRSHELSIDTPERCYADDLAMWRSRLAYSESCWTPHDGKETVITSDALVLQHAGSTERFENGPLPAQLALRGRSFGAVVDEDRTKSVWRLVDRGRACPKKLASVDAEEEELGPISIARGSLLWGLADQDFKPGRSYPNLRLQQGDATGRCAKAPEVEALYAPLPAQRVRAASLDGRTLYYAGGTAIRRLRLAGG